MSAYAAGCEVCGADLEAHARRRRLEAADEVAARRLAPIDWSALPMSPWEAAYLAITLFALVWVSFLGVVLGLLGALHGYYEGRRGWLALCGALAAVSLTLELSRL